MKRDLRNLKLLCCLAAVAVVGCDKVDPPAFRLNMVEAVSNETAPEYQQEISNVLGAMFGTPDEPYALPETGLDLGRLRLAAGAAWSDEAGSSHGLYRRHCVHCHGITGDGRGPTARFLNPYPRDYRPAVYKFKSTYLNAKPTDEDLLRVLVNGVPGTAMPSFSLLPNSEVEALIEYVKYLSMRGQMETELILYVYNDLGEEEAEDENGEPILDPNGEPVMRRIRFDPENDAEQREVILEILTEVVEGWNGANDQIIVPEEEQIPDDDRSPEEVAASIVKGRELFYGTKANCVKCHGPTGLGDGQQDDQDNWNKAHKEFLETLARETDPAIKSAKEEVAATLYPVRNSIPRNLRKGVYRGGRRRIDVFWKIYTGMAGTPMPGLGPASAGATGTLTEQEMWNIVDYVLSLPYETPSQPQKTLPKNPNAISSAG
ncbi:MAG: cytochrome c [Planctomycetes bacterium]|nr:cytochrome c [Planctomycetota bacterium]